MQEKRNRTRTILYAMVDRITEEVKKANEFGHKIEDLVLARKQAPTGDRNTLLIAYLSLAFEFHRAILSLIEQQFYGAAFALVRPIIEATVRAHVTLMASDEVLQRLYSDEYRTNLATVGAEIDAAFSLEGFFERFLKQARTALHSYTHAGLLQLGRRFRGTDLAVNYREDEIIEVIRASTSAVFMVNNLMTKHFVFEEEWKKNSELFDEWGKHPNDKKLPAWMRLPSVYQKAD
jgi:hypothetical protein